MKKIKAFLLYVFVFLPFVSFGQSQTITIQHGGMVRNCIVYTPAGYNSAVNYPLVFNLHGYTSNAAQQQLYSKMNLIADQYKFIVAYPNGLNNSWNSGFVGTYGTGVDDVGFVSALIDSISSLFSVNPQRVYTCGMSNGGFQSYRMACELSNRIAAMASVTGLMTDSTAHYCNPTRKMPVMQIHGTNDVTVPYSGMPGLSLSVDETINFWTNLMNCPTTPDVADLPNSNLTDLSTVTTYRYSGCNNGNEVLLYKVINGSHTWPGGAIDLPSLVTNRDIDASLEIWKFFEKYTLSGPVGMEETNSNTGFNISPNPALDVLWIETKIPVSKFSIIEMSGKVIFSKNVNTGAGKYQIPVSDLQSGIYFILLENSGGISRNKFIKF